MESLSPLLLAAMSLESLMGNVLNILWVAIGLGMVIFFHELGHFAVAKWCNVNVERFSIGFGPVLLSWKWGETEYALSLIPFGGYVKMLGQDDSDPSQLTSEELAQDPRSYIAKNVWQRMAIISAGVTMNVLTAILFFGAAYWLGVQSSPPILGDVRVGMPAWQAGLDRGDIIQRFNGERVTSFSDIALGTALSSGDVKLQGLRRDGKTPFDIVVHPDTSGRRPQIGVDPTMDLVVPKFLDPKSPVAQPGTAAARANPPFQSGDRLAEVDGHPVESFAQFQEALARRTKEDSEILVKRPVKEGSKETEDVTIQIGTNYFRRMGLRFDCGPIVAIRTGSPADQAGLKVGDKLVKVDGRDIGNDLDPLKLPNEFADWAGRPIEVVVNRQTPDGPQKPQTLTVRPEDKAAWTEPPYGPGSPISIPALGMAFHLIPVVVSVEPGSPAELAGIKPGTRITKFEFLSAEPAADEASGADEPKSIVLEDSKVADAANRIGYAFWLMQFRPLHDVKLTLREKDETNPREVTLTPVEDKSWRFPPIGLAMQPLQREEQANGPLEALQLGVHHTRKSMLNIYLTLQNLFTGRLSPKELHGPIGIAAAAYQIAEQGIAPLLMFLGFLSVNLAVLNFLPIPVLDGGHMVFLLWEAVFRRRPSEKVLIGATYAGMIMLLGLMVFVLYLDIFVHPMSSN